MRREEEEEEEEVEGWWNLISVCRLRCWCPSRVFLVLCSRGGDEAPSRTLGGGGTCQICLSVLP